jgi:hypothetical protein
MDDSNKILLIVPTLGRRVEYLTETLNSILNNSATKDIKVIVSSPKKLGAVEEKFLGFLNLHFDVRPGTKEKVINDLVLENSNYEYFNWLGDDDRLTKNSLSNLSTFLDVNDHVSLVYGNVNYIDKDGKYISSNKPISKFGVKLYWLIPGIVKLEGGLIRVKDFIEVGGLDIDPKHTSPDIDITFKLCRIGKITHIDQDVAEFRIHKDSATTYDRDNQLRQAHTLQLRYLTGYLKLLNIILFPIINSSLKIVTKFLTR